MKNEQMYREIVLDNYKNPKNYGTLKDFDLSNKEDNPLCGDEIGVMIKLDNKKKKVNDIKFSGHGCAISLASTSLLTEHVKGKSLSYVRKLSRDDMIKLLGVDITPMRLKCALLGWNVLQNALRKLK